jgi:hydrogenase expression/formation protein HypC
MGIVGRVVQMLDPATHAAEVEVAGARRRVNASLVVTDGSLPVGAYVLINMGMALEVLEERDALEHIKWLRELEEA